MTIAVAVAVVLGLGAGVAWTLVRGLREIGRFEEWDEPIVRQKRKGWR